MTCPRLLGEWVGKPGLKPVSFTSGRLYLCEDWKQVLNTHNIFLLTRALSHSRASNHSGVQGLLISDTVKCNACSNTP